MSEFGKSCERRKLRVNVDKSKVMQCSGYGNVGRMHARLNGDLQEKWIVLRLEHWGHKRMENVKEMWYT